MSHTTAPLSWAHKLLIPLYTVLFFGCMVALSRLFSGEWAALLSMWIFFLPLGVLIWIVHLMHVQHEPVVEQKPRWQQEPRGKELGRGPVFEDPWEDYYPGMYLWDLIHESHTETFDK